MNDNKLCWNHMVDGYVYMAVLCAYIGISRQDIYIFVYIGLKESILI